ARPAHPPPLRFRSPPACARSTYVSSPGGATPVQVQREAQHLCTRRQREASPVGDDLTAAGLARANDRVADLGRPIAVLERRPVGGDIAVAGEGREQVMDLVDEAVLPADHVPMRPPPLPERVVGLADQDRPETGRPLRVLELVEPLEVERERALVAVDLPAERVLPARREARGLD